MANPMKGEAIVHASTGEFRLAFTFGTAAAMEKDFGKSVPAVMAGLSESQSVTDMMRVVWHGLQKHHKLTLEEVGDVVTMAEAALWGEAIGQAMGGSDVQPDDEASAGETEGGKDARPPNAKA